MYVYGLAQLCRFCVTTSNTKDTNHFIASFNTVKEL